jgi:hypothetical protein
MEVPFAPFPITYEKLILYASHVHSTRKILASSVPNYISGIVKYLELQGLPDPRPTDNHLLSQVIEGNKRLDHAAGIFPQPDLPIGREILRTILTSLDTRDFSSVLFGAYVTTCYAGWFRANELVETEGVSRFLRRHLSRPNREREFGIIQESSKMLQRGPTILIPIPDEGDILSAAWWLDTYEAFLPAHLKHPDRPYFMNLDGSPYQYRVAFKELRQRASHFPELLEGSIDRYGTHSIRVGKTTDCALAGMSEVLIKKLGRWASRCYERYIRPTIEQLLHLARSVTFAE